MNVRSIYDKEESLLRAKSDLTPNRGFQYEGPRLNEKSKQIPKF